MSSGASGGPAESLIKTPAPGSIPGTAIQPPVRLVVGHLPLQVGDLRSNRRPGIFSGTDVAQTAPAPDHNLRDWPPKI